MIQSSQYGFSNCREANLRSSQSCYKDAIEMGCATAPVNTSQQSFFNAPAGMTDQDNICNLTLDAYSSSPLGAELLDCITIQLKEGSAAVGRAVRRVTGGVDCRMPQYWTRYAIWYRLRQIIAPGFAIMRHKSSNIPPSPTRTQLTTSTRILAISLLLLTGHIPTQS